MKDILFVANYIITPTEVGNDRFRYIIEKLSKKNKIELVSSNFSHERKAHRQEKIEVNNYKLTLLNEPGYKKNISLKRFYSHWVLSKNLKKYLKTRKKPDIIYCAIPSLSFSKVVAKYAKKNKIKFIIDIQDLWPEAFKMIFNPKMIGDICYYPFKKQADFIYKSADEIVAVSETYVQRGISINEKVIKGYSVFLGNDLKEYDELKKNNNIFKNNEEFWVSYVGTLGHSYDLKTIIDALKLLQDKYKIYNIKFIVLGDGPLKKNFEEYSRLRGIQANFLGRVKFQKVIHYLDKSDIVVNPIVKGAAQSIINKVGDYAAAGKAVINTQECLEYRKLVEDYKIGFNCKNSDFQDIAKRIFELYKNKELREEMGLNNRKLAEEKFDRNKTYKQILELLEK